MDPLGNNILYKFGNLLASVVLIPYLFLLLYYPAVPSGAGGFGFVTRAATKDGIPVAIKAQSMLSATKVSLSCWSAPISRAL